MATGLSLRVVLTAAATIAMLALAPLVLGESRAASGGTTAGGDREANRDREGAKFSRLWDRTSRSERRWARRTSKCESGGDPKAIGGGGRYRGAFQFMRSTWKSSPKSPGGDPITHPYRTQAVVAVMLKRRDGAGHWPVCG